MTPHARAILDAARRELSPSAAEVERLRVRLGTAPPPPDDAGLQGPGRGAANWGLYVVAVIALVVIGIVVGIGRDGHRGDEPAVADALEEKAVAVEIVSSAPAQDDDWADEETPVAVDPDETETSVEDDTAAPQPQRAHERTARPPHAAADPSVATEQVTPAHDEDPFAAELRLIVRARRALAGGDLEDVRSTVRRHREAFPLGAFVEEAEVLDLLARCSAGVSDTTRSAASRYVEGTSPMFAERVRRACLTDDP